MAILTIDDPVTPALIAHIAGGGVAMLAGGAALFTRKGAVLHRFSGSLFVAAMLVVSVSATILSVELPLRVGVVEGVLAFYFAMTAWLTIRLEGAGFFSRAGLGIGVIAAALGVGLASRRRAVRWVALTDIPRHSSTSLPGSRRSPSCGMQT